MIHRTDGDLLRAPLSDLVLAGLQGRDDEEPKVVPVLTSSTQTEACIRVVHFPSDIGIVLSRILGAVKGLREVDDFTKAPVGELELDAKSFVVFVDLFYGDIAKVMNRVFDDETAFHKVAAKLPVGSDLRAFLEANAQGFKDLRDVRNSMNHIAKGGETERFPDFGNVLMAALGKPTFVSKQTLEDFLAVTVVRCLSLAALAEAHIRGVLEVLRGGDLWWPETPSVISTRGTGRSGVLIDPGALQALDAAVVRGEALRGPHLAVNPAKTLTLPSGAA